MIFSSDRQGTLCIDTGIFSPYGCYVPNLWIGTHTITAIATDAFGATATDEVTIVVVNTQPTATITYLPSSSTYYTNQTINFSSYGFDPDEEIKADDLAWHSNINGDLGNGPALSTKLSSGDHTITLTVTDEFGLTGTDMITVSVMAGDGHQSAQIISPADGTLVSIGNLVTFIGTGTDPEDGNLSGSSLAWMSDTDGDLGTGEKVKVSLSGSSCGFKEHVVTLIVTDSDGKTARHSIRVFVGKVC